METAPSTSNPSKAIRKAELQRQKEAYQYIKRIKERDHKAFEIMNRFNSERDALYAQVADSVFYRSENLREDAISLLQLVRNKSFNNLLQQKLISR